MVNSFDPDHWENLDLTVSYPLGERPLWSGIPWHYLPFQGYLGVGRDGQSGEFTRDDLLRLPLQPAGDIQFGYVPIVNGVLNGGLKEPRVNTYHRHHRAGLSLLVIFLHYDTAILTLGRVDACGGLIMELQPIGAQVHPSGIRVLHNDGVAGSYVSTPIPLKGPGHRELKQINILAGEHVLQDWPGFHPFGWHRLHLPRSFQPGLGQSRATGLC